MGDNLSSLQFHNPDNMGFRFLGLTKPKRQLSCGLTMSKSECDIASYSRVVIVAESLDSAWLDSPRGHRVSLSVIRVLGQADRIGKQKV